MKNKQRYLEPIFAQWLDISTSDNATRACLEGGVWADKTNYSCPRLSAAPAPSLEEDGDLDMSIYVYTVGRIRWGLCDCDLSLCQCIPCKNERTQQSELAIKVQTMPLVVMFECETEIDAIWNSVHKVVACYAPGRRTWVTVIGCGFGVSQDKCVWKTAREWLLVDIRIQKRNAAGVRAGVCGVRVLVLLGSKSGEKD